MKMESATKRGAIEPLRGPPLFLCFRRLFLKDAQIGEGLGGGAIFVSQSSSLPLHSRLCQNRDVNLIDCIICTKRGELICFRVGCY